MSGVVFSYMVAGALLFFVALISFKIVRVNGQTYIIDGLANPKAGKMGLFNHPKGGIFAELSKTEPLNRCPMSYDQNKKSPPELFSGGLFYNAQVRR